MGECCESPLGGLLKKEKALIDVLFASYRQSVRRFWDVIVQRFASCCMLGFYSLICAPNGLIHSLYDLYYVKATGLQTPDCIKISANFMSYNNFVKTCCTKASASIQTLSLIIIQKQRFDV